MLFLVSFMVQAQVTNNTAFAHQGIPRVYVQLHDNKKITDIKKETKIFADMRIENANGSQYNFYELYDGMIQIKGRGNSSWIRSDK